MVDVFRFLMAVVVIASHTSPWKQADLTLPVRGMSVLIAMAVSYFFLCSGYFLGVRQKREDKEGFLSYLDQRIGSGIKMYAFWVLLYFPLAVYGEAAVYHSGLMKGIINIVTGIFLRGQNYDSWPLWYLLALLVSMAFIKCCLRAGVRQSTMLQAAFGLFLAGRMLDWLYAVRGEGVLLYFYRLMGTQNGVFTGFFYVAAGMALSRLTLRGRWRYLAGSLLMAGMAVGIYFQVLPAALCTAVSAVFLFCFALKTEGVPEKWGILLRRLSRVMYFVHMLIGGTYMAFLQTEERTMETFWLTLAGSVGCGLIVCALWERKGFAFLKEIF